MGLQGRYVESESLEQERRVHRGLSFSSPFRSVHHTGAMGPENRPIVKTLKSSKLDCLVLLDFTLPGLIPQIDITSRQRSSITRSVTSLRAPFTIQSSTGPIALTRSIACHS